MGTAIPADEPGRGPVAVVDAHAAGRDADWNAPVRTARAVVERKSGRIILPVFSEWMRAGHCQAETRCSAPRCRDELNKSRTTQQSKNFLRVLLVDLCIPVDASLIVLQRIGGRVFSAGESEIAEKLQRR